MSWMRREGKCAAYESQMVEKVRQVEVTEQVEVVDVERR